MFVSVNISKNMTLAKMTQGYSPNTCSYVRVNSTQTYLELMNLNLD